MEIVELSVKDLRDAIRRNSLWNSEIIPISKHRAISQVNNPQAKEDDVILFLAYEGPELVGSLGVVPGIIHLNDQPIRIGWLSAWWARPRGEKPGYGTLLLQQACRGWQDDLLASSPSKIGMKAFDSSQMFNTLKELDGIKIIYRFNLSELLPAKFPSLARIRFVLSAADGIGNIFMDTFLRLWKKLKPLPKNLEFEYVSMIDGETDAFIRECERDGNLIKISSEELDWIFRYPWIL